MKWLDISFVENLNFLVIIELRTINRNILEQGYLCMIHLVTLCAVNGVNRYFYHAIFDGNVTKNEVKVFLEKILKVVVWHS